MVKNKGIQDIEKGVLSLDKALFLCPKFLKKSKEILVLLLQI